jgi:hypothetical protein
MRRKLLVGAFGIVFALVGGLVAHAATSGTPEIDRANATMQLTGNLKTLQCTGEDTIKYETLKGTFKGAQAQQTPDATDYSLAGGVTINGIKWTINLSTGRGVLTGSISLIDSTGAAVYSGKLTLVSQGVPVAGTPPVPARGWIVANFLQADDGVAPPNDDYLIANVEFKLSPSGAVGQFGDLNASLGFPDWSVVTNVAPKAGDGTC